MKCSTFNSIVPETNYHKYNSDVQIDLKWRSECMHNLQQQENNRRKIKFTQKAKTDSKTLSQSLLVSLFRNLLFTLQILNIIWQTHSWFNVHIIRGQLNWFVGELRVEVLQVHLRFHRRFVRRNDLLRIKLLPVDRLKERICLDVLEPRLRVAPQPFLRTLGN